MPQACWLLWACWRIATRAKKMAEDIFPSPVYKWFNEPGRWKSQPRHTMRCNLRKFFSCGHEFPSPTVRASASWGEHWKFPPVHFNITGCNFVTRARTHCVKAQALLFLICTRACFCIQHALILSLCSLIIHPFDFSVLIRQRMAWWKVNPPIPLLSQKRVQRG